MHNLFNPSFTTYDFQNSTLKFQHCTFAITGYVYENVESKEEPLEAFGYVRTKKGISIPILWNNHGCSFVQGKRFPIFDLALCNYKEKQKMKEYIISGSLVFFILFDLLLWKLIF